MRTNEIKYKRTIVPNLCVELHSKFCKYLGGIMALLDVLGVIGTAREFSWYASWEGWAMEYLVGIVMCISG